VGEQRGSDPLDDARRDPALTTDASASPPEPGAMAADVAGGSVAEAIRETTAATQGGQAMAERLAGRRVAVLAADGVERVEYEQPVAALREQGAQTELLSLDAGEIVARDHDLEPAGTVSVDRRVADADAAEFDALVLPGGTVNPDKLRTDGAAVAFVREFVDSGRPVAAICHGPWTLVEAGVVGGRTMTSYPSIRTDLANAGANVVDDEVVIDANLITSRSPADLPGFCAALVEQLADPAGPR